MTGRLGDAFGGAPWTPITHPEFVPQHPRQVELRAPSHAPLCPECLGIRAPSPPLPYPFEGSGSSLGHRPAGVLREMPWWPEGRITSSVLSPNKGWPPLCPPHRPRSASQVASCPMGPFLLQTWTEPLGAPGSRSEVSGSGLQPAPPLKPGDRRPQDRVQAAAQPSRPPRWAGPPWPVPLEQVPSVPRWTALCLWLVEAEHIPHSMGAGPPWGA